MACYTTQEVVQLIEDDGHVIESICMEGSDDGLGLEEVDEIENEDIQGIQEYSAYT